MVTSGVEGTLEVSDIQLIVYMGLSELQQLLFGIPAQCDPACAQGCAVEGSEFCESCRNYQNTTSLECKEFEIRSGYCHDSSQPEPCMMCAGCSDGNKSSLMPQP